MGCTLLRWPMVGTLNPHPSHETKSRRMGHPEIQLREFECCGRVCLPRRGNLQGSLVQWKWRRGWPTRPLMGIPHCTVLATNSENAWEIRRRQIATTPQPRRVYVLVCPEG